MQRQNTLFDFLSLLPAEIQIEILSRLEVKHLAALMLVAQRFDLMTHDNHLWFRLFDHQHNFYDSAIFYKDLLKTNTLFTKLERIGKNLSSYLKKASINYSEQRKAFCSFYQTLLSKHDPKKPNKEVVHALLGALTFELSLIEKEYVFLNPSRSRISVICDEGLRTISPRPLSSEEKIRYLTAFQVEIKKELEKLLDSTSTIQKIQTHIQHVIDKLNPQPTQANQTRF